MTVEVNYLAILLAAVVSMIIGFIWYSQMMFAKPWMKLMGYTKESLKSAQKEMGMLYGLSFVVSLITAYVLTRVMAFSENFYQNPPLTTGFMTAFWTWLGFIMPVQLTGEIFGGKKWKLFAINTGYQLVSIVAMAVVLAVL